MKKSFLFIFFGCVIFLFNNPLMGQSGPWKWARQARGNSVDEGMSICTDLSGNVYFTGLFESSAISFNGHILVNADPSGVNMDGFLVKYDSSGNFIWAQRFGHMSWDWGGAVTTDKAGNVYLTGTFSDPYLVLGADTLTLVEGGAAPMAIFVAKFDPSGNVLWARSAGGINYDVGGGISADTLGNVFITGYFSSPEIIFGTDTLTNIGPSNTFVLVDYDTSGNVKWAKSAGEGVREAGYSVAADNYGNAIVTGNFQSSTITFGSYVLTRTGTQGVFIAKYNSLGNVDWARSPITPGGATGYSVTTDVQGNIYTTGSYNVPSISFDTINLTGAGQLDIYFAKYDPLGNVLWAKTYGGAGKDEGLSVAIDNSGDIYCMGGFLTPVSISMDAFVLNKPPGSCPFEGYCDPMFIAKFDPNGNVICASALSSGGDDPGQVATDNFGNVYFTGDFMADNFYVGHDTLKLFSGDEVIFLAKYSCSNSDFNVIEEQSPNSQPLIFPNPSNGNFSLYVPVEGCLIQIYDMLGKQLYKKETENTTLGIDLSCLNNGVYFMKAIKGSYNYSTKIIIQK